MLAAVRESREAAAVRRGRLEPAPLGPPPQGGAGSGGGGRGGAQGSEAGAYTHSLLSST